MIIDTSRFVLYRLSYREAIILKKAILIINKNEEYITEGVK